MNIYNYIDNYGIYSFAEEPINEVDNVIFSFLSYANYKNIFDEKKSLTINEVARIHMSLYPNKDKNIIAIKEGNKLLRYIKDTKRYKDCLISNYHYIGDKEVQFGVISIEYLPNKVYVSFEGTDQLFSGWIEDLMLSYKYPTKSHMLATNYLNKHFTFSNKELIVGGHSKGGNLALIASMNANFIVRSKIKKIINADGPGVLDKEYNSKRYNKIINKYTHIIPSYSFVGLFLNQSNEVVVSSINKGILSHNIIYWEIDDNSFKRDKLCRVSTELKKEIANWGRKYSDLEKEEFVINLENTLEKAHVHSILDLKTNSNKILSLIYESKDINENTKKIIIDFVAIIIKSISNTKKEELKSFITNMFSINRE